MLGRILPIIAPIKKKSKEFKQDGYYCEECEQIFDDETIYDKQRKMFLCQQCKSRVK
jgi:predicted SprT family Zn-dependent metalloprotease